jgi:hypothetical protein
MYKLCRGATDKRRPPKFSLVDACFHSFGLETYMKGYILVVGSINLGSTYLHMPLLHGYHAGILGVSLVPGAYR